MAQLVHRDRKAILVQRAMPVLLVRKVRRARRAIQGRRATQGLRAFPVRPAQSVRLVLLVRKGHRARRASRVSLIFPGLRGQLAPLDHKEILVLQDHREPPVM